MIWNQIKDKIPECNKNVLLRTYDTDKTIYYYIAELCKIEPYQYDIKQDDVSTYLLNYGWDSECGNFLVAVTDEWIYIDDI